MGSSVDLYHHGTKRFETWSGGAQCHGSFHTDELVLQDNEKIKVGAGGDLEIYHDGTHNYLNFVNGALIFRDDTTNRAYFHATDGHFLPWADNTYDLGAVGNGWRNIYDRKGNLRSIPANAKSSAYTLIASDAGKHISTTAAVTIPPSVFSVGDAITIYNDSGSDIALTRGSGVTMYNSADATNADRTLAGRGLATLMMVGTNHFVISGAGLS